MREQQTGTAVIQCNGGGLGCGLVSLLTVAFVVLKLTGTIDWSWAWVLSPVWGALVLLVVAMGFAVMFLGGATALFARWINKKVDEGAFGPVSDEPETIDVQGRVTSPRERPEPEPAGKPGSYAWEVSDAQCSAAPKPTPEEQAVLAHAMAQMLQAGVGLLEFLQIASSITANAGLRWFLWHLDEVVKKGEDMAVACQTEKVELDPGLVEAISKGESEGSLDATLPRYAASVLSDPNRALADLLGRTGDVVWASYDMIPVLAEGTDIETAITTKAQRHSCFYPMIEGYREKESFADGLAKAGADVVFVACVRATEQLNDKDELVKTFKRVLSFRPQTPQDLKEGWTYEVVQDFEDCKGNQFEVGEPLTLASRSSIRGYFTLKYTNNRRMELNSSTQGIIDDLGSYLAPRV